jgi:hypothetical protein
MLTPSNIYMKQEKIVWLLQDSNAGIYFSLLCFEINENF